MDNTRSICVGLSPCAIPAVGHSNFEIEDGKMEFGIGHHGEPGINVQDLNQQKTLQDRWLRQSLMIWNQKKVLKLQS